MDRIAIDFDGVLHDYQNPKEGRKMGEPIKGALKAMIKLRMRGYTLVIHTIRGNRPKHVEEWLDYYGIPYDEVTDKKPDALYYIDDKALCFNGDWDVTLEHII
jgi:hypothetical protein